VQKDHFAQIRGNGNLGMSSHIIVMLTHNDQTVENAIDIFESCSDLPIENWGFKDIGLEKKDMDILIKSMKKTGKKTYLEVVTYSERNCMDGAKLAVDMGFDYLMGTIYYKSVFEFLSNQNIRYLPFCGNIHGNPSILEGSVEEIITDARSLLDKGVFGIDLLAFRHTSGTELAETYCQAIPEPVVIAGSINSLDRLNFIHSINPWGFTMGSALFEKKFAIGENFRSNLVKVKEHLDSLNNK
jgi:hypothetical protein